MALSAADQLLVVRDTLRGLEADKLRAEILAAGDQAQAERVIVLDAQIKVAELREEKLAAEVSEEEARAAEQRAQPHDPRDNPDAPKEADGFTGPGVQIDARDEEFYQGLTKQYLIDWGHKRGIEVKTSWNKDALIEAHVEQDAVEVRGG